MAAMTAFGVIASPPLAWLDDPTVFKPQMHVFTGSKQPWVVLDDSLPKYEGAPPPG
ncbi:hypothetical protein [Mesorhizobium sp. M7A.F.Ca.MR.148.00.0.0]|uniref:hypothetical protein n=1 Tax=Mesorhizobium sp. M7A.F.Ca.MR.148.00.0.0 TaxID=2496775 RepID=UPI001FE12D3E|nr:hypothetical protein [Mesorhizobium sp. M7A.F.Ca.MR.148.00.0.0]